MEFIEEVLTKNDKEHKITNFASILAIISFYLVVPVVMFNFIKSKLFILIFILAGILVPVIGFLLGMKIGNKIFSLKRNDFFKSKLCKKLEKEGILEEFRTDINKEYNKKTTIRYYDEICGVGLLVTETWFVFIDVKNPKYVKTNEIIKISDEVSSNSKMFMHVELINGKSLAIKGLECNDIVDEINAKYPNIKIEK